MRRDGICCQQRLLCAHFEAAQHLFRPYWVRLVFAVVIMLAGMLRAKAPLDVPWLRGINIGLAVAFLVRADVNSVVLINQIGAGATIAPVSLVVAIDAGKWLG